MDTISGSGNECPFINQESVCPVPREKCPCPGRKTRVAVNEIQERECKRWAHELHDGLVQVISSANLQVEALLQNIEHEDPASIKEHLAIIRDELKISQSTIREMIDDLRSPYVSEGLSDAIYKVIAKLRSPNLAVEADLPEDLEEISRIIQVDLFRIIQEALINVRKYAKATHVRVVILHNDNNLEIIVKDNGCGFDPMVLDLEMRKESPCFGLMSMKERTEILGGRFELDTRIGKGTTVKAIIPKIGIRGSGIKWSSSA